MISAGTRSYAVLIGLLAAFWGSQFVFIRVAVRELSPALMIDLRIWMAAPLLMAFLVWSYGAAGAWRQLRSSVVAAAVLGVLNAVPFLLIAWGERYVDAGVAAIANATVPIFVVLLVVRLVPTERVTGWRLVGVGVGLLGVGALVGLRPAGSALEVLATAGIVAASLAFALSQVYSQRKIASIPGPVLAAGAMAAVALLLLPAALTELPARFPTWPVIGSVLALAVFATAAAQLLFYRLVRLHGVSRTTLVSYLVPVAGLGFGAVLLGETITAGKVLALILILAGVAIGSGKLPRSVPRALGRPQRPPGTAGLRR